jgi:hypothetical protein
MAMGKSETRGRRGLYLKGKGDARVFKDSVWFFIMPQFCFLAPKSSLSKGWGLVSTGTRSTRRGVRAAWRTRVASIGRQWVARGGAVSTATTTTGRRCRVQIVTTATGLAAGPGKTSAGWAGFKVDPGFGPWPYKRIRNLFHFEIFFKNFKLIWIQIKFEFQHLLLAQ